MKDHRLQAIFSSFSDADWKSYLKFSRSQFEKDTDFGRIVGYAHKNRKKIEEVALDPESLRLKLRPEAKHIVFANVISQLCKHLEDYLVWSEIQKDQMNKDTLLLQAYANRGMTAQFHKQKEKGARRREKEPIGLWKDYHAFVAEYLTYFKSMTINLKDSKLALNAYSSFFDEFAIAHSNFLTLEFINRNVVLGEKLELIKFNKFLTGENEINELLKNLIFLKQENDEHTFLDLRKGFFENDYSTTVKFVYLVHLTSFIQRQGTSGDLRNAAILFDLYKYGIENDVLFPSRKIPFSRYLNILNAVLFAEEYEWAEYFVKNYSKLVDKNRKEEVEVLGKAQIAFRRKRFDYVIEQLRSVKFKSKGFESRSRWFIICSYYNLNPNDSEQLEYYISSFVLFVKRNKNEFSKMLVKSFVNSAQILLKISKGNDPHRLIEEVNNEPRLFYRKWLLGQLKIKTGHTK